MAYTSKATNNKHIINNMHRVAASGISREEKMAAASKMMAYRNQQIWRKMAKLRPAGIIISMKRKSMKKIMAIKSVIKHQWQ